MGAEQSHRPFIPLFVPGDAPDPQERMGRMVTGDPGPREPRFPERQMRDTTLGRQLERRELRRAFLRGQVTKDGGSIPQREDREQEVTAKKEEGRRRVRYPKHQRREMPGRQPGLGRSHVHASSLEQPGHARFPENQRRNAMPGRQPGVRQSHFPVNSREPGHARVPEHQRGETPGREVGLPVKRRRSVPKVQVRVPENDGGGAVPQREDEVEEGRRRVRFNEEVQMQSIGGREYVRDVVDKEGQRRR
jgi:hypothetical protein